MGYGWRKIPLEALKIPARRSMSQIACLRQSSFAMYNRSLMRALVAVIIAAIAAQAGNAKRVETQASAFAAILLFQ
jgi:hypothetical protein